MKNRKGFTLVELLAVILIVGIIGSIVAYAIIGAKDKAEDNALAITESSVKKAARIYSNEVSESSWQDIYNPYINDENLENLSEADKQELLNQIRNYKYYCVTVQELINKNLLKKNSFDGNKYTDLTSNTMIILKKNKTTLNVDKEEIIKKKSDSVGDVNTPNMNSINSYLCNNVSDTQLNSPKIKSTSPTISTIDIDYTEAKYDNEPLDDNLEHYCLLTSGDSGELNKNNANVTIEDGTSGKCRFYGLEPGTGYNVKVCADNSTTKDTSSYAACSDIEEVKTRNLKKPLIRISSSSSDAALTFYGTDDHEVPVKDLIHTFVIKSDSGSGVTITSSKPVYKCNDDSCTSVGEKTTTLSFGVRYKTDADEDTKLNFKNLSSQLKVTITGKTEKGKAKAESEAKGTLIYTDIPEYEVYFYKGSADAIDGSKNEYITKKCKPKTAGGSCTVKTPTITRKGYTIVGWSRNKNPLNYSGDVGTGINITVNSTGDAYTTITKKKLTATFDKNNARSLSKTSASCTIYNSQSSCNVTAPTITVGSCTLKRGFNENKNATTASYSERFTIALTSNKTFYAVTVSGKVLSLPRLGDLVYNGREQKVNIKTTKSGGNYTVGGTTAATNVGTYAATFTPNSGYCWSDTGNNAARNVKWKIVPLTVNLGINNGKASLNKTYSLSNTSNPYYNLTCNDSSCIDKGTASCSASSGCSGLDWSGRVPTINWSSNGGTIKVEYNKTDDSKKWNNFTYEYGTLSSNISGNASIGSDGYRIIIVTATNGDAKLRLITYLALDYTPPTITLPYNSSLSAWGMNNNVYINHSDYGSKLLKSVNAYSTTMISSSELSCINGVNDAKNFCKITNSPKTYAAGTSTDSDLTACTVNTYCHQNYYILWACSSDRVGNKTCARRTNPSASQINYTYQVKNG